MKIETEAVLYCIPTNEIIYVFIRCYRKGHCMVLLEGLNGDCTVILKNYPTFQDDLFIKLGAL